MRVDWSERQWTPRKYLPYFLRAMYRFRSLPCPAGDRAKRETPQAGRRGGSRRS